MCFECNQNSMLKEGKSSFDDVSFDGRAHVPEVSARDQQAKLCGRFDLSPCTILGATHAPHPATAFATTRNPLVDGRYALVAYAALRYRPYADSRGRAAMAI